MIRRHYEPVHLENGRPTVIRNGYGPHHHQPPFRVLSPMGRCSPSSAPPPPRAPEPYKVAPPARVHRATSFAIIAEIQPPSRSPSPSVAPSGRTSPFRGRGFRGPLPRTRSRPESPEPEVQKKRIARIDRRVSLSQQSSPKKTLIPQPNRSRSISSSKLAPDHKKPDPRRPSPKFGRRAPNRYAPSVNSAKPAPRRSSLTTNAQQQPNNRAASGPNNRPPPRRPVAGSRIVNPPIKNPPGAKRFVVAPASNGKKAPNGLGPKGAQQRAVSTEVLNSPSKIPLRRGSIVNGTKSISLVSLSRAGQDEVLVNGAKTPPETNNNHVIVSNGHSQPGALAELLRDASGGGATGTSSVVSTTTATAAQPLQIDAAAIIAERELAVKLAELEKAQQQQQQQQQENKEEPPPEPAPRPAPRRQQTQTDLQSKQSKPSSPSAKKKAEDDKAKKQQQQQDQKPLESVRETPSGASTARSTTTGKSVEVGSEQDGKSVRIDTASTTTASDTQDRDKPKHVEVNSSSLQQAAAMSVESLGDSARSTDTGVSVDTVKGMSSAREKSGVLTVKKPEAIETLSGNVMTGERNGTSNAPRGPDQTDGTSSSVPAPIGNTRWERTRNRVRELFRFKSSVPDSKKDKTSSVRGGKVGKLGKFWPPNMRCLAVKRDAKGLAWPGNKKSRGITKTHLTEPSVVINKTPGKWAKIKQNLRCTKLREVRWCRRGARVAPAEAPTTCCPPERRLGAICRRMVSRCKCARKPETQRNRSIRAKHSLTSVVAPPILEDNSPKLPDVLIEHNSIMRGAIPCLPLILAWFCLFSNFLLPGSGTIFSGLFNLCTGQPRFSASAKPAARVGALVVNIVVGFSQFFTILFCLVGWGWSIWWGVTMLRLARKYKRFKDSEAAAHDPEARGAAGDTGVLPTPGLATQVLRGK